MARIGTTLGDLGTWEDEENPGAGSQTVDSPGINGNVIKLDTAVFTEHNVNGTHKADKIDGQVLKSTVADGSTLETSNPTGAKQLRIKDLGVSEGKIAAGAVTNAKIGASAVDSSKLATDAVTTTKIAALAVTAAKIADEAVENAKLDRDVPRLQHHFTIGYNGSIFSHHGQTLSTTVGIPMPAPGALISMRVVDTSSGVVSGSPGTTYSPSAAWRFAQNDKLAAGFSGTSLFPSVNGTNKDTPTDDLQVISLNSANSYIIVITVEFD